MAEDQNEGTQGLAGIASSTSLHKPGMHQRAESEQQLNTQLSHQILGLQEKEAKASPRTNYDSNATMKPQGAPSMGPVEIESKVDAETANPTSER